MTTRRWIAARAAQGAFAGMAIGVILGAWECRVHGDLPHHMTWLALGRILPRVAALGLAGLGISLVLAALVAGATHLGRRAAVVVGIAVAALGAWGCRLALSPYRSAVFPLERESTGRLATMCIALVVGIGALLCLVRVVEALRPGPRNAPGRVAYAASIVTIAACLLAALGQLAFPALGSFRAGERPSVLIVSLDTLRADRLGFLGNPRGLTPRLDAMASEGVVFEHATAPAPWTLATHASVFTSKLPFDHDARLDFQRIVPEHRMLAEDFRQAGYRTGAFTGDGYVSATFGFGQGFEIYGEGDDNAPGALPRTLKLAGDWIRGVGDAPFFLFVHTYEVHSPYTHPDRADASLRGRLEDRFTNKEIEEIRAGRLTLTENEREFVRGLYDGDVAYMDGHIGEFLETLRRDGVLDRTVLVVLSDHGDDLWEHDVVRSPGHGHSLYQELLHVPLFVRGPGTATHGARIATPVSLLDVAPTVLELAGLPRDPEHDGRSLATTCRSGKEPQAIPVASESTEYGPDRFALRDGKYKVIFTPWPEEKNMGVAIAAAPLEIFDLDADPHETTNLASSLETLPQEVARMVAAVRERGMGKKSEPPEGAGTGAEPPSEELLKRLKALGYVQ